MKVNVSGSIEVGQSFPSYVEEKFNKEVVKFFDNIPGADVRLKKEGSMIFTSIVINDVLKSGVKITAEAEEEDAYISFDEAFKKLITQLRKEKNKMLKKKKKGSN